MGERRRKIKSRNKDKGPRDKETRGRTECGGAGRAGEIKGGKWDNCNCTTIKK